MSKYHISPSTGRANICRATKRGCPLGADSPHFATKEEARAGYEAWEKSRELPPAVKKENNSSKDCSLPPVPTLEELRQEEYDLEDQLYGYSIRELLELRNVGLPQVEKAELEGGATVMVKVPSYYEVDISTDLARHALALPSRAKTAADLTPLRKAHVALSEANELFYGKTLTRDEAIAAQALVSKARERVRKLEREAWLASARQRVTVEDAEYIGGRFREVKNEKGKVLGNITVREGFYWAGHVEKRLTLSGGAVPRNFPVTLGHYGSEQEALDAILEAKKMEI